MLYHTSGTQLLDNNDEPAYLQAILSNANSRMRKYPDSHNFVTDVDNAWIVKNPVPDGRISIQDMIDAKVNVFDMAMMWMSDLHDGTNVRESLLDTRQIKACNWCSELGIPYIVGMYDCHNWSLNHGAYHQPSWLRAEAGYGAVSSMAEMADVNNKFWAGLLPNSWSHYIDGFKYLASKLKDDPYFIGFAPANEVMHHTYNYQSDNPDDWNSSDKLGISYRDLIEEFIDEMRTVTGQEHLLFVDRPYLRANTVHGDWSKIKDIRRSNRIWESHKYYDGDMTDYMNSIQKFIDVFVTGFGSGLYIGEWSSYKDLNNIYPNRPQETFDVLRQIADYFRSTSGIVGDCFYGYEQLWGNVEGNDSIGMGSSYFSSAETDLFLDGMWEGILPIPNGGNEMSVKYTNETSEDQILFLRKVVIQDTLVAPVPAGATITFDKNVDEEIVTKDT
jgi:hypothetical protein